MSFLLIPIGLGKDYMSVDLNKNHENMDIQEASRSE